MLAAAFLPLMQMYAATLEQVYYASSVTNAQYIAKTYMERVKNVGFSKKRILEYVDVIEPPLGKPPLEFNGRRWRVQRIVSATQAGPVEVTIRVFQLRHKTPAHLSFEKELRDTSLNDSSFLRNKPKIGRASCRERV